MRYSLNESNANGAIAIDLSNHHMVSLMIDKAPAYTVCGMFGIVECVAKRYDRSEERTSRNFYGRIQTSRLIFEIFFLFI